MQTADAVYFFARKLKGQKNFACMGIESNTRLGHSFPFLQPTETRCDMNQAALEHVLRSQQFNPELLRQLFTLADQMEKVWEKGGDRSLLSGCWAVNLFLQPSTRTHTSFPD